MAGSSLKLPPQLNLIIEHHQGGKQDTPPLGGRVRSHSSSFGLASHLLSEVSCL